MDRSATEQLLDLAQVGSRDRLVPGQLALAARGLDLEQVALARLLAHELAAAGDPEALLGTGVRLVLRHFWIPLLGRRADGPGLRTPRGLPVGR